MGGVLPPPLPPAPPAGFVPLAGPAEPRSPQAAGLHWADGLLPAPPVGPGVVLPYLGGGQLAPLGPPFSPDFRPMDLEQVGAAALLCGASRVLVSWLRGVTGTAAACLAAGQLHGGAV